GAHNTVLNVACADGSDCSIQCGAYNDCEIDCAEGSSCNVSANVHGAKPSGQARCSRGRAAGESACTYVFNSQAESTLGIACDSGGKCEISVTNYHSQNTGPVVCAGDSECSVTISSQTAGITDMTCESGSTCSITT